MTGNNSNREDGDEISSKSSKVEIPPGVMLAPTHVQEKCDDIINSAVYTALKSNTDYSIRKKLENYQDNLPTVVYADDTTHNAYKLIENNLPYFENLFNKRKDERKTQIATERAKAKEARNKYYFSWFIDLGKNISNLWNRIKQASKPYERVNSALSHSIYRKSRDDINSKQKPTLTEEQINHNALRSAQLDELEATVLNKIVAEQAAQTQAEQAAKNLLTKAQELGLLDKIPETKYNEAFKDIIVSDAQEGDEKQQNPPTSKTKSTENQEKTQELW